MGLTYRDAGVDTDEGDALVERIKPHARRTLRPEVLAGIGGFGGLFEVPKGYREPVLVAGTDGVGTKLKLAFTSGRHETVGIDLAAMSVNDVVVCGAEPVVFLDYFATSRLRADQAERVIAGIAEGCVRAGCALIGGETAELPGFYAEGEYDLAGFGVGVVEKSRILDGSRVRAGDVVLGLASSGLHSNGYSLARKVFGDRPTGELLAVLRAGSWPRPRIFELLQRTAKIDDAEMLRTFNCGVGMCAVVRREDAAPARDLLQARGQPAWEIGVIEAAPGLTEPEVVFR